MGNNRITFVILLVYRSKDSYIQDKVKVCPYVSERFGKAKHANQTF